ncbi:T9SS type B sorting domain-containing protein [Flavobacterium faecale]|uniref:T9SS type B sorting domain-containing protein n=1 Tax=Flavobacterium faecale TaxID=1355330 RepID=UPI003AACD9D0
MGIKYLKYLYHFLFLLLFFTCWSQNVKVSPTFTYLNSPTKTYTVADLKIIDLPLSTTAIWYDALTGGTILSPVTPLVSGKKYFLETVPAAAIGTRLQTIVYEITPTITADKTNNICVGEIVKITASNLLSNEQFSTENTSGLGLNLVKIAQFENSTYYVKQQKMSWEDANNLINAIPGASMYIINSTTEETAIYNALTSLGLASTTDDGIAYWLGLKQYPNANNFSDSASQGGWYWIDGTPMTYTNWSPGEPNDYRDAPGNTPPFQLYDAGGSNDEDYAQFDYQNRGIKWNDAPNDSNNRNSFPIFEFTFSTGLQWFQFNTTTNNYDLISGETKEELIVTTKAGIQKYRLDLLTNGATFSLYYEIIKNEPQVFPIDTNLTTACATTINTNTLEEQTAFNTSTFESTILGGQTGMIVTYQDATGNILPSPLPNPFVTGSQNVTVKVANSSNPSCVATTIISFSVTPSVKIESIDISDLHNENSVTVELENNLGPNQFSLNGASGPFQESNFFNAVAPGRYEVYVKDSNNCSFDSKTIYVIGAPQFFTPNGDGYNDYWNIKGIDTNFNSNSIIHIYDRYGKFIKELQTLDQGWDGTYAGNQLPASDYWYTVKLGDGRIAKGHFSLKR